MKINTKISKISAMLAAFCVVGVAHAVGPQNSRSATSSNVAPARAEGRQVTRGTQSASVKDNVVSRSAVQRPSTTVARSGGDSGVARTTARSATTTASRDSGATTSVRSARSATIPARSATTTINRSNVSRAAMSRATAVFDDVSKIGGGYAQCREAYATCMDQFCAKANDTYRRCFCSERFTGFRDTEDALDQAKILLQQFEDNNLNAVDKTAAEVDAMYSATVGEAAIKNDTSGAAKILAEIGDLISGKKKASNSSSSTSLGVMSLDFSSDIGDVFGGGSDPFSGSSSIFGGGSGVDLTTLEGEDLFNHVHKQCASMVADSCNGSAVANMAKSAYGIMISQDCNAYEKSIDTKRQQVQNTVRQAEKILREARLEEYRAHNSQDVNECLDKVRSAMLMDTACGANYKRCLDPTGAFINQSTGEPIYTARLFQLADLINLDGENADVLGQNDTFAKFLDERKMFATTALDSCRDISDLVWTEFKRSALIEIAQAQEEKLESVRMSCVNTMKECYDTQSGALKDFDDTTAGAAGAISAYAARQMCADKVVACAALYGSGSDNQSCEFDGSGRITNGERCGLGALLSFVDTVDTVRVAEGCDSALDSFVKELCTPTRGGAYPENCLTMTTDDLKKQIQARASLYCVNMDGTKYNPETASESDLTNQVTQKIVRLIDNLESDIAEVQMNKCYELDGIWVDSMEGLDNAEYAMTFYDQMFKTTRLANIEDKLDTYGACLENTIKLQCDAQNSITGDKGYAKYDETSKSCVFADEWYEYQCTNVLEGYWENNTCYWDATNVANN